MRVRDCNTQGVERETAAFAILILSLLILLSDLQTEGEVNLLEYPQLLAQFLFLFLSYLARNFFFLTMRVVIPYTPCVKTMYYYVDVEDRLLLEQYDLPITSFQQTKKSEAYTGLV